MSIHRSVRLLVAIAVLAMLASPPASIAQEVVVPPWYGNPDTTFQDWAFPNNLKVDVAPNGIGTSNPAGNPPTLNVIGDASWAGGVWTLGQGGAGQLPGRLQFLVPNHANLGKIKEVWVQVIFTGTNIPGLGVASAQGQGAFQKTGESTTGLGGNRFRWLSMWSFPLCPQSEFVTVRAPATGTSGIDLVRIDTRCFAKPVPEPASLITLGLSMVGLIGYIRRGRRLTG